MFRSIIAVLLMRQDLREAIYFSFFRVKKRMRTCVTPRATRPCVNNKDIAGVWAFRYSDADNDDEGIGQAKTSVCLWLDIELDLLELEQQSHAGL